MLSEKVSSKAMLIHHHSQTGVVTVTSHSVIALEDGKAGFTLGAGRAFSPYDKSELATLLLNEDAGAEFLPESYLFSSRTVLAWYRRPGVHDIPILGERIRAPLPGLIFIAAANQSFRCFAFKGNQRPTPETELFYAPLGNVYQGGTFCTGSGNVPRDVRRENIPAWESFVLESDNTHSGTVEPVAGCRSFEALKEFYRALSEKGSKRFPASKLVSAGSYSGPLTLAQAIKGGAR